MIKFRNSRFATFLTAFNTGMWMVFFLDDISKGYVGLASFDVIVAVLSICNFLLVTDHKRLDVDISR